MGDQNANGEGSDLIYVFPIPANSSNCNKTIQLDRDVGVASVLFVFGLSCTDISACDVITSIPLTVCSKTFMLHAKNYIS